MSHNVMMNALNSLQKRLWFLRFFLWLAVGFVLGGAVAFVAGAPYFFPQRISEENLQKFYEITKEDPLFYDPAMDVEFLRESVEEMRHADDLVLYVDSLFRPQGPEKYRDVFPDGWRLWPDEFLSVLPDIHETTARFLKTPSTEDAVKLLALYRDAAAKYKKAIDLHTQAMNNVFRANPKAPKTKILFLGSGTTPEIVYNDFLLIQKNAEALKKEIAARKKCLYLGACEIRNLKLGLRNSAAEAAVNVPFKPLPDEVLGIKPDDKIYGPYWTETSCFGRGNYGRPLQHPFYLKEKNAEGGFLWQKPFLTNEKYYRDYSLLVGDVIDISVPDITGGLGLLRIHSETNDYLCSDLRYFPNLIAQSLQRNDNNLLYTLPHIIQNTLEFSWFPVYHPFLKKTAHSPLYLLVNRSAYSLYFGTFTSAMWRLAEEPQFLLRNNSTDFKKGYATYHDLLERGMTPKEIAGLNSLPSAKTIYKNALIQRNQKQIPP